MQALQYLVDLGPSVMMPIIFTVFALCLGVKFGKAIRSGLLIGIGFIGLNLVITLLTENLGPAAEAMVANFGLHLNVLDVGWPAASAIAFGSTVGVLIIPLGIIVNIIMLLTRTTRTVNIDIWNFWHFAFTGSLVYMLTGNLGISLLMSAINMIITMVIADRTAPKVEKELGLPGISIPHGFSASYVPIAWIVNKILDVIPGINKIKLDANDIQKKFGIFGDPAILGTLIGVLLGLLAKYNVKDTLNLAVIMGAVLVLTPKMAAILMEGLMPVSESVQELIQRKFAGKAKLYIGLDSAVSVGHPVTLAVSLVLVPVTLLLAVIVPGNQFLPFASLAGLPFMFVLIVPLAKGDFFRTFVIGVITVGLGLLIGTNIAPLFTEAAVAAKFAIPDGARLISSIDYGSSPLPWLIIKLVEFKTIGLALITAFTAGLMVWNRKKIISEDAQ
ncbi:PTS galactitol transporter subunit IIC [Clostridium cadaveris]|uniref:PTS system IIC component, Gat family n=1 Tax=Clostridium cadaveris TaxID=1529 RepID=A0A1I2KXI8_9CLOT|nr:PTS transporter subunit IIC [Clostridium cadaveris]MDM8311845.1 PTS transporter subunit IIC [Clostridium cadaveris]MDY4949857.1 PTS transporter subunit IIC [Clostridium cadaveris]NME64959.1 PTS sugar transporter subunit IIC [Clostridium cadaveris]SFF69887.1 PTS system IIC component, Gat family [Clostridium cadaveris]